MNQFTQFISENMYIVAAALYVLGVFFKRIPSIPDWTIPFVLTVCGVAFGVSMVGLPEGILQGVLCAGGAVLVNQMIKQTRTKERENHGGQDK